MSEPSSPQKPKYTVLYRIALAIAASVSVAAFTFFVIGIGDGSISSFNSTLWLFVLAVSTVVPIVGLILRSHGRTGVAIVILSILAIPGLVFGLFTLLILVTSPNWH